MPTSSVEAHRDPSDPPSDAALGWSVQDLSGDPHARQDKASRVRRMFAAIAGSYDLNNRVHSLGRDQAWRRAAVKAAQIKPGDVVVDVACGTGDLSLAFADAGPASVIGIDFTVPMLELAQHKRPAFAEANQTPSPVYLAGDATSLPLPDACCDVVSIAFGIRNVAEPAKAFAEFVRVLRPGGRLIVLEFSTPTRWPLRTMYSGYFHHVLPRTATWIARDKTGAYRYLPRSVDTFLDRQGIARLYTDAGFTAPDMKPQTFGIAVVYRGEKQ